MFKRFFIILFLFLWLFQNTFWNDNFFNWEKLESKIIKNNEESPYFDINFQRPSYVDDINWEEIIYKCNDEKDECKVNFNFTKDTGKALSSKLECNVFTDFESEQFNRCNPNTVVFPEWTHEISIKVSEKDNSDNFSIRKLVIINLNIDGNNKYFDYLEKSEKLELIRKKVFSWEVVIKTISGEAKIINEDDENTNSILDDNLVNENIQEEVVEEDGSNNDNSWELDENKNIEEKDEKITETEKIEIPDFKYLLQNPSYILKKGNSENNYFCDKEKEECKVNFKLVNKDISSKFICEIISNFDIESEKNKCNPNTIIIPENTNQKIIFRVYDKEDISNFKEIEINIENIFEEEVDIQDKKEEDNNKTTEELDENKNIEEEDEKNTETEKVEIPDFKYLLQNPSYISKKENLENNYFCDKEKEECKVNFKLTTLEEEKDISSKFSCEIISDLDIGSENNKCNPNTITIPENTNQKIIFKIYDKEDISNFKEIEINIDNIFEDEVVDNNITNTLATLNNSTWNIVSSIPWTKHYLPYTKIEVQWKIWKNKKLEYKKITCLTYNKCSINFTSWKIYKSSREGITFKWSFWNWEKYYWYNPKSIKYSPWKYRTKLLVYDNYWNKKVEYFNVNILKKYKVSEKKKINKNIKNIFNYKNVVYNKINKDYLGLKKDYFSKNITKYRKKYTKKVILKLKNTSVKTVFKKLEKWKYKKEKNNTYLLTEAKLKENKISELKKNIKLRINFQKKNLKISWTTFPDKKVVINIWNKNYDVFSNSNWIYLLKTNNISPWKYKILVSVYSNTWEILAKKFSREKVITQKYINNMKSYLYKKTKTYKKKKVKKDLTKNNVKSLKVSYKNTEVNENKSHKIFNLDIFIINIIISILGIIMFFFALLKTKILE